MATTIRELLVEVGVVADTKSLKSFDAGVERVRRGLQGLVAIATGAAVGIIAIGTSTGLAGDEVAKLGRRLGVTAEEAQELDKAAKLSGASTESLEIGLKTLNKTTGEARRGMKEYAEAYRKIGFADLNRLSDNVGERLEQVATGIAALDNTAEKTAIADKLLGEGGTRLLPLLEMGGAGIRALREEIRASNTLISNETAAASEVFADRLLDAQYAAAALKNEIGAAFLPVLTDLLVMVRDAAAVVQPWLRGLLQVLDATVGLRQVLLALVAAAGAASAALGALAILGLVGSAIPAISAFLGFVSSLAAFLGVGLVPALLLLLAVLGQLALSAAPIVLALAPFLAWMVAIGLAVEDVIVYLQGGKSALGEFIDTFIDAPGVIGATLRFLRSLGGLLGALVQLGLELAGVFGRSLPSAFDAMLRALQAADDVLGGMLSQLLDMLGLKEPLAEFFRSAGVEIDDVSKIVDALTAVVKTLTNTLSGQSIDFGSLLPNTPALLGGPTTSNRTSETNVSLTNGPITLNAGNSAAEVLSSLDDFFGRQLANAQDAVFTTER